MEQTTDGSFQHWVSTHKRQTIALGSIVTGANILIGIGSQLEEYKHLLLAPWFSSVWYGIHLSVVLYLFGLTYKVPIRTSISFPKPSDAVRDFYYFLLALWFIWAVLYCALAFRAFDERDLYRERRNAAHDVVKKLANRDPASQKIRLEINEAEDIAPINEALRLAAKYPADSDVGTNDLKEALKNFRSYSAPPSSRFWEFLLNWINNAQAAALLLLYWVLAYPRKKEQPVMILLVVVVGTFLSMFVNGFDQFKGSMGLLGGIFGGLAMAMWVGRLDSKFLMIPPGVICALYFYAILQATWIVFPDADEKLLIITGIAMVLKVVVYFVCSWLLSSGRLLYFFQELRLLYGEEGTEEGSMRGITVKDRLKAFLDDLEKEEVIGSR